MKKKSLEEHRTDVQSHYFRCAHNIYPPNQFAIKHYALDLATTTDLQTTAQNPLCSFTKVYKQAIILISNNLILLYLIQSNENRNKKSNIGNTFMVEITNPFHEFW